MIPCKDCLILPICKHKLTSVGKIFSQLRCNLLNMYMIDRKSADKPFSVRLDEVVRIFKVGLHER